MILQKGSPNSRERAAVLETLRNEERNQQLFKSKKGGANVENEEEGQVKNEKEPLLTDLPQHTINLGDHDYNKAEFDIRFFDYNWPQGLTVEEFAEQELQGVVRVHVYAPMITDANFYLNQKCHNGFTGY